MRGNMSKVIDISNKVNKNYIAKDITEIEDYFNEEIYLFNQELDINFEIKDKKNIFNKDTFNIFCTYRKSLYSLLFEIKNIYMQISKENNFNAILSKPHIAAEIINKNSYKINQKYDFGTAAAGEMIAIFSIISQDSLKLLVDKETYSIKESEIGFFYTDSTFEFIEIPDNFFGIKLYITGLRNLDMQYYGRWIPLL